MVKTLVEKLKLNSFESKLLLHRPDLSHLADLEHFDLTDSSVSKGNYHLVIDFVENAQKLKESFRSLHDKIRPEGLYVVAYPKKGNKKFETFIHRDQLFDLLHANRDTGKIEGTSFKFNRMVALDESYTVIALKNIAQQKNRKMPTPSQRIADCQHRVPELSKLLTARSAELAFFESLSPGYQRDWARYIYSAKQQKTRDRRLSDFLAAMHARIKTTALYKTTLK